MSLNLAIYLCSPHSEVNGVMMESGEEFLSQRMKSGLPNSGKNNFVSRDKATKFSDERKADCNSI